MSEEKEIYCECSSCGYIHPNSERIIKEGKHTKEYGLNDAVCPKCNALPYKTMTEDQYIAMTKTPEEKATVQKNRTVQTNSEKTNLTAEEKAREYAGKADESRRGFQDYIIVETKYKSFLKGYHSRDEEVKELREALREIVEASINTCDMQSFNRGEEIPEDAWDTNIEHLRSVAEKAKQLLKE